MTIRDIRNNIELQGDIRVVEYDYERDIVTELDIFDAIDREIKYMYCEDGFLVIEVENLDED